MVSYIDETTSALLPPDVLGQIHLYLPFMAALKVKLKKGPTSQRFWRLPNGEEFADVQETELFDKKQFKVGVLREMRIAVPAPNYDIGFNAAELSMDGASSFDDAITRLFSIMDDTSSIQNWLQSDQFKSAEAFKSFAVISASFAVYFDFVRWCVSDRLEEPWNGASSLPRSIEDLRGILSKLAFGVNEPFLALMRSSRPYSELIRRLTDKFDGSSPDNEVVRCQRMGVFLQFGKIADAIIDGWVESGLASASDLANQLKEGQSISLLERTLSQLSGYNTYGG